MLTFRPVFSLIILSVVICLSVIIGCTKKEDPQDQIFLKGSFNNWSLDNPFMLIGEEYAAEIQLPEGSHAFKIADSNWSQINLGAAESFTISLDQEIALTNPGSDIFINVFEPEAKFVFLLRKSEAGYSLKVLSGILKVE